jgi:membrane-bound lytic murein transglycosylase D
MNPAKSTIYILSLIVVCLVFSACSAEKTPVEVPPDPTPAEEREEPVITDLEKVEQPPLNEAAAALENTGEYTGEDSRRETQESPEDLLDSALDAYQDAQTAWDRADLETALKALDEAYSLLLKISIPADSPLQPGKDELRLLIARRIQEIYTFRRADIGGNHQSIPLEENKHVENELKLFQGRERKDFLAAYERSGYYRAIILEELRKEGMPEELSWMPVIESWFKTNAYSRARALGLWQFISSTGLRYGLKRDRWIDERMDYVKASQAAVKYLKELHEMFGDWTTALAAYNCGEFRVQRVIKAQRANYMDNFWDLYLMLPRETARFVPRFIATLLIINDPGKYDIELPDPAPPLEFSPVLINKAAKLSALAQAIQVAPEVLERLNPELRHKSTPDSEYPLRVPAETAGSVAASLASVPSWIPPEATYVIHYVRRGETVSAIADRYRTSISAIGRLNSLGRRYLIRPGQRLKVPARGGSSPAAIPRAELAKEGENLVYTVSRGDSLYLIANAYSTTISRLRSLNNLSSDTLQVGQKLIIQQGTPENSSQYVVESGDTPYEIARKFDMTLDALLAMNGLNRRSRIYPGQKLWVNSK